MGALILLARVCRRLRADRKIGVSILLTLLLISLFGNAICFYVLDGRKAGLSFGDAMWYSVVSVTTIGYGDLSAASTGARIGTVFFIMVLGLATFTMFLGMMIDWIAALAWKGRYGMGTVIAREHVLLVNFPSEARVLRLIEELQSDPSRRGKEILVISDTIEKLPFDMPSVLFLHGSPLEEETYRRARIRHARLAIVLPPSYQDTNGDAVVASACSIIDGINSDIRIVAECMDARHAKLFQTARCDAVVQGIRITDNLLVQEIYDPGVAQMIEMITSNVRGTTVFSTAVPEDRHDMSYTETAKDLLERKVNLMCVNRGPQSHTTFDSLTAAAGDQMIYVAEQRLTWQQILAARA